MFSCQNNVVTLFVSIYLGYNKKIYYIRAKLQSCFAPTNPIKSRKSKLTFTNHLLNPRKNTDKQDLIKLLSEEQEDLELDDGTNEEIDTNQDYKAALAKVMGQIYHERQRWSKNSSSIMLLLASM